MEAVHETSRRPTARPRARAEPGGTGLPRARGNAATARLLQRKPVLADPVTNKYTDVKVPGVELSYVFQSGTGLGTFMEWAKYHQLAAYVPTRMAKGRKALEDDEDAPVEPSEEILVENMFQLHWGKIGPMLTDMYGERATTRELKRFSVAKGQAGFNFRGLANAALHGPFRRGEHGSRLPASEGILYVDTPHARYAGNLPLLREELLLALGVAPDKMAGYQNVQVQVVPDFTNVVAGPQRRIDAAARGDIANGLLYVSQARTPAPKTAVQAAGLWYLPDFSDASAASLAKLKASWKRLARPAASGPLQHTQLAKAPRDSQAAAMQNWNAAGAMAYAKHVAGVAEAQAVDLNQQFEWLHVRASSLGGLSVPGNLVTGSFVVNSAMTPWEGKLRKWRDATGVGSLEVTFTPTPASKGPLATNVTISVKATNHPVLQDTNGAPVVSFDPIRGRVYDRMSYGIEKSERVAPLRRPYATRPAYVPAIGQVQAGQAIPAAKAARIAKTEYELAVRRLNAAEAVAATPAAAAADAAYRAAIGKLRAGNAVSATDPAELAADVAYRAAVAAISAGNVVGPTVAAQAALADYRAALTVLEGWFVPVGHIGPPPNIVVANNPAAQAASNDYVLAWAQLHAGLPVAASLAEQTAVQAHGRQQTKRKR